MFVTMQTLAFWLLFLLFVGAFAAQVATRVRLIAAGAGSFSFDQPARRIKRFVVDVVLQRQTIRERPAAGVAHALVFWGFVAFGGYTIGEFLRGLGIIDITHRSWFILYRLWLLPFAAAVLVGIVFLLVRRVVLRPAGLGATLSIESVVIALLIATLMATFIASW